MFIVGKTFESQTDGVVRAQTGRERADNMDTPSVRSLSRHQSPGRNPDGAPDETTSIVHGQVQRDYQSTQTSGSRRRRNKNDAPPAEHGEQEDAAGGDGDGVDHVLREVSGDAVSARCVWVGGQDPGHRDT